MLFYPIWVQHFREYIARLTAAVQWVAADTGQTRQAFSMTASQPDTASQPFFSFRREPCNQPLAVVPSPPFLSSCTFLLSFPSSHSATVYTI